MEKKREAFESMAYLPIRLFTRNWIVEKQIKKQEPNMNHGYINLDPASIPTWMIYSNPIKNLIQVVIHS